MKSLRKVVIIQRVLSHYRRPFYELLRERLAGAGIELVLIHGSPSESEARKKDGVEIEWAHSVKNRSIMIGQHELYWQPCLKHIRGADLVIAEQASKLILNYVLVACQMIGLKKVCFWGHGRNFQEHNASVVGEGIKRFMSRHAHWWFAYNDLSASVVRSLGYPENRITSVQNAIDTRRLVAAQQNVTQAQLQHIKRDLGIKGDNICLYTGGMYPEKRLDFLIEACVQIRKDISDFEMIFIGGGPDDSKIKEAAEKHKWIHYLGPKFDEEKVPYFMVSKLFLMPDAVGLSVLDAFALKTPLITTNSSHHGPEISYLVDGVNGVIVRESNDPSVYAAQVSRLLKDDKAREKLIAGCCIAREKYSIEEMAERFAEGVIRALAS
ncbi:MAG: glycosyltransferase family 4 protein [Thermodesulfovibrionales bacterium]|nr:glycosyltransferase family 4 protein [Thermodesulfovibrionales bacterium]